MTPFCMSMTRSALFGRFSSVVTIIRFAFARTDHAMRQYSVERNLQTVFWAKVPSSDKVPEAGGASASPYPCEVMATMTALRVAPLDETTWSDFARLVEMHNGVWGGSGAWPFHPEGVGSTKTARQNPSEKERRVREGRAHAMLVYDGPSCVGC